MPAMRNAILAVLALLTLGLAQAPEPREPIDFRRLQAALPATMLDLPRDGDPAGERVEVGGMKLTRASADYRGRGAAVALGVVDYAAMPQMAAGVAAWRDLKIDREGDEGLRRTTTVAGEPALLTWDADAARGEVVVFAGDRFLLTATVVGGDRDALERLAADMPVARVMELAD